MAETLAAEIGPRTPFGTVPIALSADICADPRRTLPPDADGKTTLFVGDVHQEAKELFRNGERQPVDLDALERKALYSVRGELFALVIVEIDSEPGAPFHRMVTLLTEDDGNWFIKMRYDAGWLEDLYNVVSGALTAWYVMQIAEAAEKPDNG